MQLKYMGSKSWSAPHVDWLLGDVADYRRPALAVRGVDARAHRKPAHRCFEARSGLPALLAAPGRAQSRQALLLSHLLPGIQRGRAGRRAACSYVLLRTTAGPAPSQGCAWARTAPSPSCW